MNVNINWIQIQLVALNDFFKKESPSVDMNCAINQILSLVSLFIRCVHNNPTDKHSGDHVVPSVHSHVPQMWEFFVLFAQFFYKLKTAFKRSIKVIELTNSLI